MKIDCDFITFVKNFQENFPNFLLRVREKNDEENIAYYSGTKAFTVEDKEDYILLNFPTNTYQCNITTISKCESLQELKNYRESLYKLCQNMTDFYNFSMPCIRYCYAKAFSLDEIKNRKDKFIEKAKQYGVDVLEEDKKIKFEGKMSAYQIIMMQYYFLFYMVFDINKNKDSTIKLNRRYDTLSNIKFDFKATYRKNRRTKEYKINKFKKTIVDSLDHYKGANLLEKRYQHNFMLQGKNSNIFLNTNRSLEPFEEEYEIVNTNRIEINEETGEEKTKGGRIDCIFYDYQNLHLKNIYLLEMKVNDPVILKSQGVLTHLDDIKEFLNDKDQVNKLIQRIQYRHRLLYDEELDTFLFVQKYEEKKANIHFYTIIGYTDDKKLKATINKLNKLIDEKSVESLNNNIPKWAISEKQTIPKIMKEINQNYPNSEIKFFRELTKWNKNKQIGNLFLEGIIKKESDEFEWLER